MKKKKILGFSDYGPTGLPYSLRLPLSHWHAQGHEVWLLGCGYDGNISRVDRSAHMYPYADRIVPASWQQPRGHAELPELIAKIQPDIVFSDLDLPLMKSLLQPETDSAYASNGSARHILGHATRHFTHIALFPLDDCIAGGFINHATEQLIAEIDVPVCHSRFSHQAILRSTGLDVPYIPLPIDKTIFYPRNKAKSREKIRLAQDIFIIAMAATNELHNSWGDFLEVMGRVTKRHPNIRVMPWTMYHNDQHGYNIEELFYHNNLGEYILHPGSIVGNAPEEFMADLYSSIDLLVHTLSAQSSGIAPMQARACGTPTLVSAHTTHVELAGHPSELLPAYPRGIAAGNSYKQNSITYSTDIGVLEDRVEELYTNHERRRAIGQDCQTAMEAFFPENILPLWDTLLNSIA